MKKLLLALGISVLLFSQPTSTLAVNPSGSCANSPFGVSFNNTPPPSVVNSLANELRFQLNNIPTGSYEMLVMYEENGQSRTQSLGNFTSASGGSVSFVFSKSQFPVAFNTAAASTGSNISKTLVIRNTETNRACNLWEYEAYNTPVREDRQCGDLFTVGSCGGQGGGCEAGYACTNDSGYRCVENATCPSDPEPQPSPSPSADPDDLPTLRCGDTTRDPNRNCDCAGSDAVNGRPAPAAAAGYCCGWVHVAACYRSAEAKAAALNPPPAGGGDNTPPPADPNPPAGDPDDEGTPTDADEEEEPDDGLDPFQGPTAQTFKTLNPLKNSRFAGQLDTPGGIVSRMMVFAFPLGGLILFAMIVWGGFEMLTSAASSKGMEAGKQRVTAAIVGFILLFSAYWVFQIVEEIFGVVIL